MRGHRLDNSAIAGKSRDMYARLIAVALELQRIHGTYFAISFLADLGLRDIDVVGADFEREASDD